MSNRNSHASLIKFCTWSWDWNHSNVEWAKGKRDFPIRPIIYVLFCAWVCPVVQSQNQDENQTCSHMLQGNSGVLTTPNYPNYYPNNIDCHWLIHIEVGERIQLHFNVFSLEETLNTDYVKVFDGSSETDPLLGEYYGYKGVNIMLESSHNRMYVVMHSNGNLREKGFTATFQRKGFCLVNQSPCGWGEKDCFIKQHQCDGTWHCRQKGGDERGCRPCHNMLFSCGDGKQCYKKDERCNGVAQCHNSMDELDCNADKCSTANGTFLCYNKMCIYEKWLCDGTNDCKDNSDEVGCSVVTRRVILSSVVAALMCGLLVVILFGCMCRLRMMQTFHRQHQWRHLHDTLTPAPPPPYSEALMTSHSVEEAEQEVLDELQAIAARRQNRIYGQPNVTADQPVNQADDDEQLINAGNSRENEVERSEGVQIAMATGGTPLIYWRQESTKEVSAQSLTDEDENYDDTDVEKETCDMSGAEDGPVGMTSGDILSLQHQVNKRNDVS